MSSNKTNTLNILLALFCCALWGSAFPCIKIGYRLLHIGSNDTSSQILFAGLRFFLAGILVIIAGSFINKKLLVPTSAESFKKVMLLGLVQTILQYVTFYMGLSKLSGSLASIWNSLGVFIAVIFSCLIFKLEKMSTTKILGCIIGFTGVIIINVGPTGFENNFSIAGQGLLTISVTAYALSSVMIKLYSKNENPVMLSGWQFSFGGLVMIVVGLSMGGSFSLKMSHLPLIIYLAFISACAYTIWGLLLSHNPVTKITVFSFFTPIMGVLLSALILGETQALNIWCLISLGLVSFGIGIVNLAPNKKLN